MRKRCLTLTVLMLALCLGTAVPNAKADDIKSYEYASAQEVVDGMMNKLARGVANVATGWLELPKQVSLTTKEEGAAMGATVGPLKGIGMTLVRTVGGAVEIGTFFFPYPGWYGPIIEPGYVWEKE
jgi:putative exosortase-associated protein (TIGR04073 family)